MGMMLNRRRVCGGKKGLLPSGYTQVEYIENKSTAYIALDVLPTTDTYCKIKFDFPYVGNSGDYPVVLGDFTTKKTFWRICWANYGGAASRWLYKGFNVSPDERPDVYSGIRVGVTDGTGYAQCPVFLFCQNELGIPVGPSRIKVYELRFDGDIQRNFIPCISPNNVVGMYEIVEGKFYSSPNGIAFVAGPVV